MYGLGYNRISDSKHVSIRLLFQSSLIIVSLFRFNKGSRSISINSAIFIFNLTTIAFDFTADRFLMLLGVGAATGYGFYHYSLSTPVQEFLNAMNPVMNQGFYMVMFAIFTVVYIFVWIQTRVNYWEFRPNEVIHRCGFFSRAKRYRPELIKWDKMVPDILERIMLGTGTMVLTTSQEDTPVILEHVPGISNIDDRIASVLNVQMTASR